MSIIKTENLCHNYSKGTIFETAAIEDINIEIEKGELVGIIGHTGSGKSTLIQHLNGLLKPSSGKVFIDGKDIWENPKEIRKIRFKVGMVFQYPEYQLFEENVYKDIAFGPSNMGLGKHETDERVLESLRLVGLKPEVLKKSPFQLSGGQKRRAAIAGVIAMQPDVLILDEPTAGLDPHGRDTILGLIKNYHSEKHTTVLMVSHNMEDIAKYATKVLVMNKARVYKYDTVKNIFKNAKELSAMGLSLPQITEISDKLARAGFNIDPCTFTLEHAAEQVISILGGGK